MCHNTGNFSKPAVCKEFREKLIVLQDKLCTYTKMLSDMAGVEDLTRLEEH